MRYLLKVTPSARDYLILVPLLLFLAWSIAVWLGFADTIQAIPDSKGSPAVKNERTPWGEREAAYSRCYTHSHACTHNQPWCCSPRCQSLARCRPQLYGQRH